MEKLKLYQRPNPDIWLKSMVDPLNPKHPYSKDDKFFAEDTEKLPTSK